MEDVDHK